MSEAGRVEVVRQVFAVRAISQTVVFDHRLDDERAAQVVVTSRAGWKMDVASHGRIIVDRVCLALKVRLERRRGRILDLVVGSHAHAIQTVEREAGETLVEVEFGVLLEVARVVGNRVVVGDSLERMAEILQPAAQATIGIEPGDTKTSA